MYVTLTGSNARFFENAFLNGNGEVDIDIIGTPSSTQFVVRNNDNGATTTFNGTGFSFSGGAPTGGTVTSVFFEDAGGDPVATVTGIGWSLEAFDDALSGAEADDFGPLAALVNDSSLLTIDGSGMTGVLDLQWDWEYLLPLITTDTNIIGNGLSNYLQGGSGDDTITPGTNDTTQFWEEDIEGTYGDDVIDLSNTTATTLVWLDYENAPYGLTFDIDGGANTGTIAGPDFLDTLIDPQAAMLADGLGLEGSEFNDTYNVSNSGEGWFNLQGNEGHDTYNLTLNAGARLSFNRGADANPSQGLVVDLATGVVSNDGFGFTDQINILGGSGRLEIRATDNDDSLTGSDRRESFITELGDDTVDGGGGNDRVRYDRGGLEVVSVDLAAQTASGIWDGVGFTDTLISIENIRGSHYGDDTLLGSAANETLEAYDGDDRIFGRGGEDFLLGGYGEDTLDGGDGDDSLLGGGDADTLEGGTGNDTLRGDAGDDDLAGEDGNDSLRGGDGMDIMDGGDGQDTLRGDDGGDYMRGSHGEDSLRGGDGDDTMSGGTGADVMLGDNDDDRMFGGSGDDSLRGGSGNDTLDGGADNDTLRGDSGDDDLDGGDGDDYLRGDAGNDTLDGGNGNDLMRGISGINRMDGGDGNDSAYGGDGAETINGNAGDDLLVGGGGTDDMDGGIGNDTLYGNDGDDTLNGDGGDDWASGGTGDDLLLGREGMDTMRGSNGDDRFYGGADDDLLAGNNGNDEIYGGSGDDRLFGGADNDTLVGQEGTDTLSGSAGADVFVFEGVSDSLHGGARDTILDFEAGVDMIDLSGFGGLTFVSSYTGAGNEVRYNEAIGRLYVDMDGGASDFSIDLDGTPALTVDDLIL